MASTTTNIGLTKPAGTDQALISAINGNMDIIDTKMGAVGNTSVQSQITSLSDQIGNHHIKSFTLTNIAIADGTPSSPSFITLDLSSYVPSGEVIYNAIVSVKSGISWYNLPNISNAADKYLLLERVGTSSLVLKNTDTGWGTTNITVTIFTRP